MEATENMQGTLLQSLESNMEGLVKSLHSSAQDVMNECMVN